MKKTSIYLCSILLLILSVIGCKEDRNNEKKAAELESDTLEYQQLPAMSADQIEAERLRIQSIRDWKDIRNVDLIDSAARGKANYYFMNNRLAKLVTKYFGEMQQNIRKYYVLNGQLIYVFEEQIEYNRPIYYDTTLMRIEDDTVAFDLEKSKYQSATFYFSQQQPIKVIKDSIPVFDPKSESPHAERLLADFERLANLQTK